ncbi:MAG: hypothetical protein GX027_09855 [Clostridiaceae bacterium]|jgi:hypothetical protein|nr:hypothetical protein [Clostridiaceae bacterium]
MKEQVFCTVISRFRLYQAIALFCSLNEVIKDHITYVLCVDDETHRLISKMGWRRIRLLHICELNESLNKLKKNRRINEYCWTLKPLLIEAVFSRDPGIYRVTYVDADLFFFSDPSVIFKNQPSCSVLLSRGDIVIPSLEPENKKKLQALLGKYNSGFISFKRDETGLNCLRWWKKRCLESCVSKPEAGLFGDQKYLDEMPSKFSSVCEIHTPGVNIGHWNRALYHYSISDGKILAGGNRLICYHFSGFRVLRSNRIIMIHEQKSVDPPFFYYIYLRILQDVIRNISLIDPGFDGYSDAQDLARRESEKS